MLQSRKRTSISRPWGTSSWRESCSGCLSPSRIPAASLGQWLGVIHTGACAVLYVSLVKNLWFHWALLYLCTAHLCVLQRSSLSHVAEGNSGDTGARQGADICVLPPPSRSIVHWLLHGGQYSCTGRGHSHPVSFPPVSRKILPTSKGWGTNGCYSVHITQGVSVFLATGAQVCHGQRCLFASSLALRAFSCRCW